MVQALVLSAPRKCPRPSGRWWGVFAPLYALRAEDDWGVGSFADLGDLRRWVEGMGGSATATLPLFAQFLDEPMLEPSPYSPASRLFWNETYIDVTRAPGLDGSDAAREALDDPALRERIARLRKADSRTIRPWRRRSGRSSTPSRSRRSRDAPRRSRRVRAEPARRRLRTVPCRGRTARVVVGRLARGGAERLAPGRRARGRSRALPPVRPVGGDAAAGRGGRRGRSRRRRPHARSPDRRERRRLRRLARTILVRARRRGRRPTGRVLVARTGLGRAPTAPARGARGRLPVPRRGVPTRCSATPRSRGSTM